MNCSTECSACIDVGHESVCGFTDLYGDGSEVKGGEEFRLQTTNSVTVADRLLPHICTSSHDTFAGYVVTDRLSVIDGGHSENTLSTSASFGVITSATKGFESVSAFGVALLRTF